MNGRACIWDGTRNVQRPRKTPILRSMTREREKKVYRSWFYAGRFVKDTIGISICPTFPFHSSPSPFFFLTYMCAGFPMGPPWFFHGRALHKSCIHTPRISSVWKSLIYLILDPFIPVLVVPFLEKKKIFPTRVLVSTLRSNQVPLRQFHFESPNSLFWVKRLLGHVGQGCNVFMTLTWKETSRSVLIEFF